MHKNPIEKLEDIAITVTQWVGSIWSLIVHTALFIFAFTTVLLGARLELVLLVLTTLVSLEAIYLSIFIQLSVNRQARSLASVEKDIDEIQEDVEEISHDVDEIQEDIDEIQEDVEEISHDVDEIQEDIDEIQEDVDEIQEDVEDIQEDHEKSADK